MISLPIVRDVCCCTCLANEDVCYGVEGNDAVHPRRRQHHFLSGGNATADQARVSTLRDDGEAPRIAVVKHARYVLRRLGKNRYWRRPSVLLHPVDVVSLEFVRGSLDIIDTDN